MVSPLQQLLTVPQDNRVSELAAIGNMVGNLYGTYQGAKQNRESNQIAREGLDYKKQQDTNEKEKTEQEREIRDGARDSIIALSIEDPKLRNAFLQRRIDALDKQKRDSSHSRELLAMPFEQQTNELKSYASVLLEHYPGAGLMESLGFKSTQKPAEIESREDLLKRLPIDPKTGQLKPADQWTASEKAAAIEARLEPGAVGSAAQTIANSDTAKDVADSQKIIKTGESAGTASGKKGVEYLALADAWDINREYLVESIPDLEKVFSAGPGSSVSKGVQQALSKIVGNTSGADAQATIEQFGAIFLQGMPFAPGAQSDKELQARAQVLSDQIVNPNVSAQTKIKLIGNFVEWQDSKARNYRSKAQEVLGGDAPNKKEGAQAPSFLDDLVNKYAD
jgi:hypothetical protein